MLGLKTTVAAMLQRKLSRPFYGGIFPSLFVFGRDAGKLCRRPGVFRSAGDPCPIRRRAHFSTNSHGHNYHPFPHLREYRRLKRSSQRWRTDFGLQEDVVCLPRVRQLRDIAASHIVSGPRPCSARASFVLDEVQKCVWTSFRLKVVGYMMLFTQTMCRTGWFPQKTTLKTLWHT